MKKIITLFVNNSILRSKEFTDLEKIVYIHNYILSSVEYPKIKLCKIFGVKFPIINFLSSEERNYSSIYGILVNKKAFCIGIAKTLKKFFDYLNIKNKIVRGYVKNAQKGKIIHMWNIVYLNGIPYHIDATFDITRNPNSMKSFSNSNELPNVKSISFCKEHLLVSDEKIQVSHLWNKKIHSKCEHCYPEDEIIKTIESLKLRGIKFNYSNSKIIDNLNYIC